MIYTHEELSKLNDSEIFELLLEAWEINGEEIEIWGELPRLNNSTFGFLTNPYLIKSGMRLYYPLETVKSEVCRFFVSPKIASAYGSKNHSTFIRCTLEFSPISERKKHNNPFLLCVSDAHCENLELLPKNIPQEIISDNEKNSFISKSIYDFYYFKAIKEAEDEILKKKKALEEECGQISRKTKKEIADAKEALAEEEKKLDQAKQISINLKKNKDQLEIKIKKLELEKLDQQEKIQQLIEEYEKIEYEMNKKIERLRKFISEKKNFLQSFEFIDEEDFQHFLLEPSSEINPINGVCFHETLQGNYKESISYIQAYLVEQDILYPRHIIENYLTLLRTRDLIILAGDSGSGKTNLVKSFAQAVGGKSIIIPVKPNWTSSEDLLGYYNPLEKKYLSTPFLDALIEAKENPDIPYFICLDEMNLARVEYYFADFLSLLESRDEAPEIKLYSDDEASHVLSELKAVVKVIEAAQEKHQKNGIIDFIELLKDEEVNRYLRQSFGFGEKTSLVKYHSEIRHMLSAVMRMPASITMPDNVHIIGAINIDETTHYLSPKILDRAHIMRFESPLLSDWDKILEEVEQYGFDDLSQPLIMKCEDLGIRKNYPRYDRENEFCIIFTELNKLFFNKIGIEFGMRTIRQGLNYLALFEEVNDNKEIAVNNFLLHKVLPKFTFDGSKKVDQQEKLDLIEKVLIERLKTHLPSYGIYSPVFSAIDVLQKVIINAKQNDNIVNYWS